MNRFIAIIILSAVSLSFDADARKVKQSLRVDTKSTQSQTSKKQKAVKASEESGFTYYVKGKGTFLLPVDSIVFSGYDKPAAASKEAFLVTNNTDVTLLETTVSVTYKDMEDRMLHKRSSTIKCNIPPGETRKLEIPTWDSQMSYYYFRSAEPRRTATPYKVDITPLSFRLAAGR